MAGIHLIDIESAINWWRQRAPSVDGVVACAPVRDLAEVYGRLVYARADSIDESDMPAAALEAWLGWYRSTPDAPCIAICSTSQGDAQCKGCGRSFAEVQHWTAYSPAQKRAVWLRITREGSAWRFNRYAERAGGAAARATGSTGGTGGTGAQGEAGRSGTAGSPSGTAAPAEPPA